VIIEKLNYLFDERKQTVKYISVKKKNNITNEDSIKLFLITISHEGGKGTGILENGDEDYFEEKPSYTINTRGAGLIQVTGSSQYDLLDYLIKHTSDETEIEKLEMLRDGYTNLETLFIATQCVVNGSSFSSRGLGRLFNPENNVIITEDKVIWGIMKMDKRKVLIVTCQMDGLKDKAYMKR
jgi:hypothetical protein